MRPWRLVPALRTSLERRECRRRSASGHLIHVGRRRLRDDPGGAWGPYLAQERRPRVVLPPVREGPPPVVLPGCDLVLAEEPLVAVGEDRVEVDPHEQLTDRVGGAV